MKKFIVLILVGGVSASSAFAQEQHRELGAHEHGRGTLNIAVEGNRVSMEFEAPAMDIVGFEHEAKTKQHKAQIEAAKKQLSGPLSLFKLPVAAGCKVKDAVVEIESGDHDHEKKDGASVKKDEEKAGAGHEQHSEFHGQYTLECASPAAITTIEFPYFRIFTGAQKLDVNLVTSKGQSKFDVTRDKPRIDLSGVM